MYLFVESTRFPQYQSFSGCFDRGTPPEAGFSQNAEHGVVRNYVRTSVLFPYPRIVSDIHSARMAYRTAWDPAAIWLRYSYDVRLPPLRSHNSMGITLALMRQLTEYPAVVRLCASIAQEAETGQSAGGCSQRRHRGPEG